jgi:hypothetical protein
LLSVERERGWLTLVVADPPTPGGAIVVSRYMVGMWGGFGAAAIIPASGRTG